MKNTNFCAKANMKRDVNRVEPARRVLLKAGAVLLAVLVLFCTACGKRGSGDAIQTNLPQSAAPQTSEPVPQQGGTLKLPMPRNLNKDNLNYNPLIVTTEEALGLYSLVFESLIGIDESNRLIPSLAINWSADEENANSWIINLRENVKWHSGDILTAGDVVYTFNQLYTLGSESYYASALSSINRIEMIDATTLRVTMNSAGIGELYSLSFPIIHENAEPFTGTGAYRASYVSNTKITLKSNEEWWDRPPYIDTVEFHARESNATALASYGAGQLNFVPTALLTVGQYSEAGKTVVTDMMTQNMEVMLVNHNRAFVSRVEFRRAIAHALNRTKLITNAYMNRARAADVPVPPDSWLYNSNAVQYDFNLNSANAILDELGSRVGADGRRTLNGSPIELTLLTSGTTENTVRSEAAGMIAEQLAAVGITVKVVTAAHSYGSADSEYMTALAAGDWDLALCGFNLAQSNDLEPYLGVNGKNNFGHYNALNRTKLITNAYMNRARAADVPVPPDSWLYNSNAVQYDFNLNSANAILDELGSRVGADGRRTLNGSPIELTLLTSGTTENTVRSEAAGMIAEQLAAVGITVKVVTAAHSYGSADSEYMTALAAGDWDLALCGFNLAQSNDLEPYLGVNGKNNFGHYNAGLYSGVSAALNKMNAAADEESLRNAAYELQTAFADELPFIVLYFRLNSVVYSAKLREIGTMREPALLRNIKNWYFIK